jgi:hypothetical protein
MGALKEVPEESTEVSLRRQLLDKSKENDKVCGSSTFVTLLLVFIRLLSFPMQLRDQIQAHQAQLAQRPPIEAIQELRKEYSNLELILQGTQRENERAMTELERLVSPNIVWKMAANSSFHSVDRGRQREKLLERELEKLAGSNWQVRALSMPALSREAHHPCALAPLPCTPYSFRLTSGSHLPVSLAHSPRVPRQVDFLPKCSTLRRQPRPTVT